MTLPEELGCWRRHVGSDSVQRARAPFYRARLARERAQLFNRLSEARGGAGISVWRSGRYYLRWLRGAWDWLREDFGKGGRRRA